MSSLGTTDHDGERLASGLAVWIASTEAAREAEVAEKCSALLSPEERAACQVFHHEADRRRALVARALVRTCLSHYAPVPPRAWRFEPTERGRPEIASPSGTRLRFNLSHTRELVACAVTLDRDVGVDVEREKDEPQLDLLARETLTASEARALQDLALPLRAGRFYAAWTLKESYLKARGLGLELSPRSLELDFAMPGRVRARFGAEARDDPSAWWFALLRADPVHVLALALRVPRPPAHLEVFGTNLSDDDPVRMALPILAVSAALEPQLPRA